MAEDSRSPYLSPEVRTSSALRLANTDYTGVPQRIQSSMFNSMAESTQLGGPHKPV